MYSSSPKIQYDGKNHLFTNGHTETQHVKKWQNICTLKKPTLVTYGTSTLRITPYP